MFCRGGGVDLFAQYICTSTGGALVSSSPRRGDVNNDGKRISTLAITTTSGVAVGTGRAYVFSGLDGSLIHLFNAENKEDGWRAAGA
jgi:hypothetical protein